MQITNPSNPTKFDTTFFTNLADHTDKLLASLTAAEAGLKGANIGPDALAKLTALKTTAVAAVESQRERLEQGVINALAYA